MIFYSIFFAQDLKRTVRDMKFKFGRGAAWNMHLGHEKNSGHMTTTEKFDQGSVLSSVSNVSTLLHSGNTQKTRSEVSLRFYCSP